jgi:hypothetical protein
VLKTYDQGCTVCAWEGEIWAKPYEHPPCPACSGVTERRWKKIGVIGDEIPGGQWIENLGPKPVKVYSKSERRALAAAQGLTEMVRHMPLPGSDKSPHTVRWTGTPDMRLPKHYEDKQLAKAPESLV